MLFNIKDADKAEVLVALVNAGRPMLPPDRVPDIELLTLQAARMIIDRLVRAGRTLEIEYFVNRSLKIDLSGDIFDSWLYDRDNGDGVAARALANVRGVVLTTKAPTDT